MSGDHLNKLSMSTASLNSNSIGASSSSHNPVKLVHALSPLNHRYVKLNVGGYLFNTSIDTLTKCDNMLRAMFSGRIDVLTDADGFILIDRCGRHFEIILNYLRDEDIQVINLYIEDKSDVELYNLLKEAKFYCIQVIANAVEQKIMEKKITRESEPYFGNSIVSMVTSKSELNRILNSSDKPFIRILINRHNNKYSYTNSSDDNLLKNIELFERMSIKFKNRIMFIKDTTSTEEICCWYFHGSGRKMSEVCCTSIVYSTEKKQTKVEFPDSRILEEIFVNAVLFESKETNNESLVDDELSEDMPRITLNPNTSNSYTTSLNPCPSSSGHNTPNTTVSTATLAANLITPSQMIIGGGSNSSLSNPGRRSNNR